MRGGIVTVDAVHRARRARRERLRLGALDDVFRGLALLVDRPHERESSGDPHPCDVFDAHARVGVPVDGAASTAVFCPGPPTYIVSIVAVSVFVSSSAYSRMVRVRSPMPERRRVAGAAGLERGPQHGRRRNGPRVVAGDDVTRAAGRRPSCSGRAPGRPRRCGTARRRPSSGRVLPRGVLRVHRRVAGLAAELGRLHRVQRALRGEQDQRGIDDGQRP